MNKDTLYKAQIVNDTEETLQRWLNDVEKEEVSMRDCLGVGDMEYLKMVRQEMKDTRIKILKKHQAIKAKEFEAIK